MLTPRLAGVLRLKVRGPGGVDARKTQRRVAPTIPCHLVTYVERFDVCVCLCICVNKNICISNISVCNCCCCYCCVCSREKDIEFIYLWTNIFSFVVLIIESLICFVFILYLIWVNSDQDSVTGFGIICAYLLHFKTKYMQTKHSTNPLVHRIVNQSVV